MKKGVTFNKKNASGLRIGLVTARWNAEITTSLRDGAVKTLKELGVKQQHIVQIEVPGSFELVSGAKTLIDEVDAVICVGVLIKGETMHFEYISQAVSHGIMSLNIKYDTPVLFGVLTVINKQQAIERSQGKQNHGVSWAHSAVEMALLLT